MNDEMKKWLLKVQKEFTARALNHKYTADVRKLHGDYHASNMYNMAATSWTSAADMLQLLIEQNYDCLKEFLYNITEDDDNE